MTQEPTRPAQTKVFEDVIHFSHNRAFYLVGKIRDHQYIDITMADPDVLASIGGIYTDRIFYRFTSEQLSFIRQIRDQSTYLK